MKIFSLLIFLLAFFTFVWSFTSADFSSSSFTLENPIEFMEGGQSSSSSFQYISTTGQFVQGQSFSASFLQNAGFLYFPDVVTITPPPSGGGGGNSKKGLIFNDCSTRIADFNCDNLVNIFDLSILLYYVDLADPTLDPFDLNDDNEVDFIDTSIVFYHWDL